mmetsp:Transcript_18578/g.23924  ORF Transcript_18578/g.23924 Transcript_18578/m.23924 type:complete len:126 (+) Transcript_18578:343-720(+)
MFLVLISNVPTYNNNKLQQQSRTTTKTQQSQQQQTNKIKMEECLHCRRRRRRRVSLVYGLTQTEREIVAYCQAQLRRPTKKARGRRNQSVRLTNSRRSTPLTTSSLTLLLYTSPWYFFLVNESIE